MPKIRHIAYRANDVEGMANFYGIGNARGLVLLALTAVSGSSHD
jgi:hypothetical protein